MAPRPMRQLHASSPPRKLLVVRSTVKDSTLSLHIPSPNLRAMCTKINSRHVLVATTLYSMGMLDDKVPSSMNCVVSRADLFVCLVVA